MVTSSEFLLPVLSHYHLVMSCTSPSAFRAKDTLEKVVPRNVRLITSGRYQKTVADPLWALDKEHHTKINSHNYGVLFFRSVSKLAAWECTRHT